MKTPGIPWVAGISLPSTTPWIISLDALKYASRQLASTRHGSAGIRNIGWDFRFLYQGAYFSMKSALSRSRSSSVILARFVTNKPLAVVVAGECRSTFVAFRFRPANDRSHPPAQNGAEAPVGCRPLFGP